MAYFGNIGGLYEFLYKGGHLSTSSTLNSLPSNLKDHLQRETIVLTHAKCKYLVQVNTREDINTMEKSEYERVICEAGCLALGPQIQFEWKTFPVGKWICRTTGRVHPLSIPFQLKSIPPLVVNTCST